MTVKIAAILFLTSLIAGIILSVKGRKHTRRKIAIGVAILFFAIAAAAALYIAAALILLHGID